MSKAKSAFFCNNCGYEAAKWAGKCPACNEWNTFTEELIEKGKETNTDWEGYHQNQKGTIISYEYPADYDGTNEPYYPVRDDRNTKIYQQYHDLTKGMDNYIFGGRLGSYVYYDMHQVIAQALLMVWELDKS